MATNLPSLERILPEGQLVDWKWLEARGFTRPRIDYALQAGNLEAPVRGLYRRPGPPLKWEQVVYSLNEMRGGVHVRGRSAFELQGRAHFLPVQGVKQIEIHAAAAPPKWLENFPAPYRFRISRKKLFKEIPQDALEIRLFGSWDWPIPYSTPELALLEMLGDFESESDFEGVEPFFEGAATLRPDRIQRFLEDCTQVKAKRLFLWFSRRHNHAWAGKLDRSRIDLGSGKREIAKGGSLDAEFLITVPREMAYGSPQPLF